MRQHRSRRRGTASVEYLIIAIFVAVASIALWRQLSGSLKCKIAQATGLFGDSNAPACGGDGPNPVVASNTPPPGNDCLNGSCLAPGNCFVAGTLVLTAAGLEPIESITPGTLVLARDQHGGEVAWKPVAQTFVRTAPALVSLVVADGTGAQERLTVTPEHRIFSRERGWVAAATLTPGRDVLVGRNDEPLALSAAESVPGDVSVYNLEVIDYHTYFVGQLGAWAHNDCAQPTPPIITTVNPDGTPHYIFYDPNLTVNNVGGDQTFHFYGPPPPMESWVNGNVYTYDQSNGTVTVTPGNGPSPYPWLQPNPPPYSFSISGGEFNNVGGNYTENNFNPPGDGYVINQVNGDQHIHLYPPIPLF